MQFARVPEQNWKHHPQLRNFSDNAGRNEGVLLCGCQKYCFQFRSLRIFRNGIISQSSMHIQTTGNPIFRFLRHVSYCFSVRWFWKNRLFDHASSSQAKAYSVDSNFLRCRRASINDLMPSATNTAHEIAMID